MKNNGLIYYLLVMIIILMIVISLRIDHTFDKIDNYLEDNKQSGIKNN